MIGEYYESKVNTSKDPTDRYKDCKILEDKDTGDILLETREDISIPNRGMDTYHRVASNESSRLDQISQQYYNNPLLWWVIAQANDIYDPLTPIPAGTLLRIPHIESLYGNNGVLL